MSACDHRPRWIGHADVDAFYASVEQRDNPAYRGRPVVVGAMPGQRGVVAAASYEARAFGIRSAMPVAEAYRRCPDAVYIRPDMHKYRQVSRQIFAILGTVTPLVEPVSVDEAYLDLSGLERLLGPPDSVGRAIKQRVLDGVGLTVSVGIGPNRLIAKLGSEHRKPDGLTVLAANDIADFLAPLPVTKLRGLGRQTEKVFARLGIETVQQLRTIPPRYLEEHIGRHAAAKFVAQAHGIGADRIRPDRQRKSISKETTFAADLAEPATLRDVLRRLAADVAATARREDLSGSVVTLKVRYRGFETHTRQRQLAAPTHDERVLLREAWSLFTGGRLPDGPLRLIGIGISGWGTQRVSQADLFRSDCAAQQDERVLQTLDDAADRFGQGALQLGMPSRPTRREPR